MAWPPKLLVATKLQTLVKIEGAQKAAVKDVSFSGIGWRDAAYTYMERWGVPSGGDWSLYHGAALHIHGAERTTVSQCEFSRLDNNAIILTVSERRGQTQPASQPACLPGSFLSVWLEFTPPYM